MEDKNDEPENPELRENPRKCPIKMLNQPEAISLRLKMGD
jgi:hypothetical protein